MSNISLSSSSKSDAQSRKKLIATILLGLLIFLAGFQTGGGKINLTGSVNGNKDLPKDLDYSSVEKIYDQLKNQYDGKLDANTLLDGLKKGLVSASGDPYTEYLPASEAKEFQEQLSGSFEGIGAELGKDKEAVIIVSPIANMPAAKAGLKPKDIISKINNQSAFGLSVEQARNKIRGPKGTKVDLVIIRDRQELKFTITRDTINIESVQSKIVNGNTGIITISSFGDDTSTLARQKADEMKNKGVDKVILDLRGNPGGYLDAAVDVASLWLNNKVVLQEKRDGKVIKTYKSDRLPVFEGLPTIVLIDEGSASASEIVAGALRDNKAATLLGQKSFGKGSVQQPQELMDGGLLKVTIARWFTPSGKNIDKEGISPDKTVERSLKDYQSGNDPQLDAALKML